MDDQYFKALLDGNLFCNYKSDSKRHFRVLEIGRVFGQPWIRKEEMFENRYTTHSGGFNPSDYEFFISNGLITPRNFFLNYSKSSSTNTQL